MRRRNVSAFGAELEGMLGCNALIDKMKATFFEYLRRSWAPATIFRLGIESQRLQVEHAALGLPPAHEPLAGAQLEQLRAAAVAAAE